MLQTTWGRCPSIYHKSTIWFFIKNAHCGGGAHMLFMCSGNCCHQVAFPCNMKLPAGAPTEQEGSFSCLAYNCGETFLSVDHEELSHWYWHKIIEGMKIRSGQVLVVSCGSIHEKVPQWQHSYGLSMLVSLNYLPRSEWHGHCAERLCVMHNSIQFNSIHISQRVSAC